MEKKEQKEFLVKTKYTKEFPTNPYEILKETNQKRNREVEKFLKNLAGFSTFPPTISFFTFFGGRVRKIISLKDEDLSFLKKITKYNEVMTPTIRFCINEFFAFFLELQTAAYSGAARTLRCILETAIEACEFQTDKKRNNFVELVSKYEKISKNYDQKLQFLMEHNTWNAFMERYKIYENVKRIAPTFRALVKDLKSRDIFKEDPNKIQESIIKIYEKLSDYIHPSSGKILRYLDYKESFIPSFNHNEFDTIYGLGTNVLDIVEFLYIKSISNFLGYKKSTVFLKDLAETISLSPNIANNFLSLPLSKKLTHKIRWKIENNEKVKFVREVTG